MGQLKIKGRASTCIIMLMLVSKILYAQINFQYKAFSVKDGISSSNCYKVKKDINGFFWISSDNGLNRFDGNSFYVFRNNPTDQKSLGHNVCNEILIDHKNRMWVNTSDGISLYNEEEQNFTNYSPDTSVLKGSAQHIFEMGEDQNGKIWIGGFYDVLIFDPSTKKFLSSGWYKFAKQNGIIKVELRKNAVLSIKPKSIDELWLLSVYGLFSVNTTTFKFEYYPNAKIPDYWGCSIACTDDQNLWITTYDQCFYKFDAQSKIWTHITCPRDNNKNEIRINDIKPFSGDTLILVSDDKILFFDSKLKSFSGGISHDPDYIKSLPKGINKNIFVFGNDMIICQSGSTPLVWVKRKENLIKRELFPIAKGSAAAKCFATKEPEKLIYGDWASGKICMSDLKTGKVNILKDNYGKTDLGTFQKYFSLNGRLSLISTSHDIYLLDEKSSLVRSFLLPDNLKSTKDIEFRNFVKDANGNVYVRERRRGIYKVLIEKLRVHPLQTNIVNNSGEFSALFYEANTNSLWLSADDNGLFIVNLKSGNTKHYPLCTTSSRRMASVSDIQGDRQRNVFLAEPRNGVIRLSSDDMTMKKYTINDGLLSNDVRFGVVDRAGCLWFTSDKGLFSFDPHKALFKGYEDEPYAEFYNDQLFLDASGNVCHHQYPNTLFSMSSSYALKSENTGTVYLKEILLFDKKIKPTASHVFKHNDNNITLSFGYLNTSDFATPLLEYKINTADWLTLPQNHTLSLFNLSSGDYQITVRNKNNPSSLYSVNFKIGKIWWQTVWFFIGLIISTSTILLGLYKNRVQKVRKEETLKNEFQQRISKIEMSALRAQMNPHFVFNSLNSINRFILINDPDTASAYLTKFSRLIRLILDNSREESISLEQELDALKLYVELEAMRFQNSFDFEIFVDKTLEISQFMVPPLLLQPYVENAIWHGLMQKVDRGKLHINISAKENNELVKIEIIDNGVGRLKSASNKMSENQDNKKSYGIALTNERLGLLNALHGSHNNVKIEDLYSDGGEPAGTKVTISIS